MLVGECTLFHGQNLETQTLVKKKGEQIFILENVPHAPYNLRKRECVWVVVHSSGDDQDKLIATPELEYTLEKYGRRVNSRVSSNQYIILNLIRYCVPQNTNRSKNGKATMKFV